MRQPSCRGGTLRLRLACVEAGVSGSPAISTDILEFRARVLVIRAARAEERLRAALISDTVLAVSSGDGPIPCPGRLLKRTGPRILMVGCR